MKAKLKRQLTPDKDLQLLQDAVQAGLDKVDSYEPGNPTYWEKPAPTTVEEALDRMATLLYILNSASVIP